MSPSPRFYVALFFSSLHVASSFILAVDFGSQFIKAAIVRPGKSFEVVHNQHSKRKTPTAVSFNEAVRTFGDDAIASAVRGVKKTPMLFSMQLGRNLTDVKTEDLHWLPTRFYPFALGVNESGSLHFDFGEVKFTSEEVVAHLLGFIKELAIEAADGIPVSETILTLPSSATRHQRLTLLTAAEVAGLPRAQLVHETSASALQRSLDLDLGGVDSEPRSFVALFYNMGARHVEACAVRYTGAVASGKNTITMNVLGCGMSHDLGGHQVDLIVAEKMLAKFQEKFPTLSDGISSSVRALRKLEKEANNLKHVLSANREGQFRVESLFEDTDFMHLVSRADLEEWCSGLFDAISAPVEAALSNANITMGEVDEVELVGGGWRIPKVQSVLAEFVTSRLNLSQHVNGEEGFVTGAAFFAANSSASFRTKKIYFTDRVSRSYRVIVECVNVSQDREGWRLTEELFVNAEILSRASVKFNAIFDTRIFLFEDDQLVTVWDVSGVHEAATGNQKDLGTPLVSLKFDLDSSGVVRVGSALAVFDHWVEEVRIISRSSNSTALENTSADIGNTSEANTWVENVTAGNASVEGGATAADEESDTAAAEGSEATEANGSDTSDSTTNITERVWKLKKKKVSLRVLETQEGIVPRSLTQEELEFAKERLSAMDAADREAKRVDAAKNGLESFVYEVREKLSSDEGCQQVSVEEERERVLVSLSEVENWLYEDGFYVTVAATFEDKLAELHKDVDPILRRAYELEQRPQLPELAESVFKFLNETLTYVRKNMTWVGEKEIQTVTNKSDAFEAWYANVTKEQAALALTENPAYSSTDVKRRLKHIHDEAVRLTKIKKIDPMPYSSDYGKYGGYGGGYGGYGGYGRGRNDDPMRAFYESMYKNGTNGTNGSDWYKNFNWTDFQNKYNETDYMNSFKKYAERNASNTSTGKTEL